jgi:hypothetical protein
MAARDAVLGGSAIAISAQFGEDDAQTRAWLKRMHLMKVRR